MSELRSPRNDETWQRCLDSVYGPDEWPQIYDIVRPALATDPILLSAMLAHAPHRPDTVPRSLHAAGTVARVDLVDPSGRVVDGALLRLSVSERPLPGPDHQFIVGAGLRLDADPRADLVATCAFTGIDQPWPLAASLSNRLEAPPAHYGPIRTVEGVLVEQAAASLERAGIHGSALYVPAARFCRALGAPVAPIRIDPHPDGPAAPSAEIDFRRALANLTPGEPLAILELPDGRRLTLRSSSVFVASAYGDHALLFRHDFESAPTSAPSPARGCPFHSGG